MIEQFTEFYYNTFDTDRKTLAALYVRSPLMTLTQTYTDPVSWV